MSEQKRSPYRCVGIFGWMFGHDYEFGGVRGCCWRCGMPLGGWKVTYINQDV